MAFILTDALKQSLQEGYNTTKNAELADGWIAHDSRTLEQYGTRENLVAEIAKARSKADEYKIEIYANRLRFIQIHIFLYPNFWEQPMFEAYLSNPSGTGDQKFEDLCALFVVYYTQEGMRNYIWW